MPKSNKLKTATHKVVATNKPTRASSNIIKPGAVITKPKPKSSNIIKPGTPQAAALARAKSNIIKPGTPQAAAAAAAVKAKTKVSTSTTPKKNFKSSQTALQTASVIASNRSHPNHAEVSHLIQTFEKGWINEAKFNELLQGMLF